MASDTKESKATVGNFFDLKATLTDGSECAFSKFQGQVCLVVNVASKCGYTNANYTEMAELYTKYKTQGLEILAFPCNQFGIIGGQEPGTNEDINKFACTKFKAAYPIFAKVDVNGKNESPVYSFLKIDKESQQPVKIPWNFEKFLVNRRGQVSGRYSYKLNPKSFVKDIEALLAEPA